MRPILAVFVLCLGFAVPALSADSIDFWNTPQHGANSFNESPPNAEYFRAFRAYGGTWMRLSFSKWKTAGKRRDFLFDSLDDYHGLVAADLATLRRVLDDAHAAGIGIVVTPLELPGARWVQLNHDQFDDRLWSDRKYWPQAAALWRDLAGALKDHPAVVGYNLVNEPVPEKKGDLKEHSHAEVMQAWYAKARGSTRDLPALYELLVGAVRAVDAKTPIMLDAGFYAAADAWSYWPAAMQDDRTLYAYHMYEPWEVTSAQNLRLQQPLRYPGTSWFGPDQVRWDATQVAAYLQLPVEWAKKNGVPLNRLVAAEFGCMRQWVDCPQYLEDVLAALDANHLHWAFYSFRESWDGMDYELGADKLPWAYWQAREAGKPYELARGPNKVFEPIQKRLRIDALPQSP
jgi:hypothetical protein